MSIGAFRGVFESSNNKLKPTSIRSIDFFEFTFKC